jgi:proline iminopeptidase
VELHHEVDGDGPPVLVLHGGLGLDHQLYRRSLQPLADRYRLVFLDHRHNGRSPRPGLDTVTMPQLAEDAAELADQLGLDRFAVLGHSYGGFVAQELAIRHPHRVDRLVRVGATPGQLGAGERAEDTEPGPPMPPDALALLARPPATDAELATWLRQLLPAYFHRYDAAAATLVEGTVFAADAAARGFEVLASWSSVDRLGEVRCPTLVVAGRHDVFTSWPQAHRIARHQTGAPATVVVLEHSGHFPWVEEPDAFFGAVGPFLAGT